MTFDHERKMAATKGKLALRFLGAVNSNSAISVLCQRNAFTKLQPHWKHISDRSRCLLLMRKRVKLNNKKNKKERKAGSYNDTPCNMFLNDFPRGLCHI